MGGGAVHFPAATWKGPASYWQPSDGEMEGTAAGDTPDRRLPGSLAHHKPQAKKGAQQCTRKGKAGL